MKTSHSASSGRSWSLSYKLYFLLIAAVLFAAGLTGLGLWGMSRSNRSLGSVYVDRVVPLEQLKTISDAYAVLIIDAVNKAQAGLISGPKALGDVRAARATITQKWTEYMATTLTSRERELADQCSALFLVADKSIEKLDAELAALPADATGRLSSHDGPLYAVIDPVSAKITELIQLQLDVARLHYEEAEVFFPSSPTRRRSRALSRPVRTSLWWQTDRAFGHGHKCGARKGVRPDTLGVGRGVQG